MEEAVVQNICVELVGPTLLFSNINIADGSLVRGAHDLLTHFNT